MLGLGGCGLPAVEIFECDGFVLCFCFCFANATSPAEAFLYVILDEVTSEHPREREHTRLPFAYGTSTAGLSPCISVPSPLRPRCFTKFRAQSRGEDGDVA
ncbi:hypothetical protein BDR06DRAFT_411390 [Suillus hirtellus]|nr:hypothetical protein BDR06DRAFT_411390 [Suillus hirtellus]